MEALKWIGYDNLSSKSGRYRKLPRKRHESDYAPSNYWLIGREFLYLKSYGYRSRERKTLNSNL